MCEGSKKAKELIKKKETVVFKLAKKSSEIKAKKCLMTLEVTGDLLKKFTIK